MKDNELIEIVKDYIAKHKCSNIDAWQPFDVYGHDKYKAIYQNMVNGVYGECRKLEHTTAYAGNTLHTDIEYQLEISANDSANGKPCIFWWLL